MPLAVGITPTQHRRAGIIRVADGQVEEANISRVPQSRANPLPEFAGHCGSSGLHVIRHPKR
jgi:hypothetical protein